MLLRTNDDPPYNGEWYAGFGFFGPWFRDAEYVNSQRPWDEDGETPISLPVLRICLVSKSAKETLDRRRILSDMDFDSGVLDQHKWLDGGGRDLTGRPYHGPRKHPNTALIFYFAVVSLYIYRVKKFIRWEKSSVRKNSLNLKIENLAEGKF